MKPTERIIVDLDTTDAGRARSMAEELFGLVGGVKLGKEFLTANGPDAVHQIARIGSPIFLDLKFHDIPSRVAAGVRAALSLNPFALNVHGLGGAAMMQAAAAAVADDEKCKPLVLVTTVLTSMVLEDLAAIGVFGSVRDQVVRLAVLGRDCGLDGAECSAEEVVALRGACGRRFKLFVSGIRPFWAATDDQKRVVTPSEALALGADFLVIGRPITASSQVAHSAQRIAEEIATVTVGA